MMKKEGGSYKIEISEKELLQSMRFISEEFGGDVCES